MGNLACNTFRSRHLDASAIYYLSPLDFEEVDHDLRVKYNLPGRLEPTDVGCYEVGSGG